MGRWYKLQVVLEKERRQLIFVKSKKSRETQVGDIAIRNTIWGVKSVVVSPNDCLTDKAVKIVIIIILIITTTTSVLDHNKPLHFHTYTLDKRINGIYDI